MTLNNKRRRRERQHQKARAYLLQKFIGQHREFLKSCKGMKITNVCLSRDIDMHDVYPF